MIVTGLLVWAGILAFYVGLAVVLAVVITKQSGRPRTRGETALVSVLSGVLIVMTVGFGLLFTQCGSAA